MREALLLVAMIGALGLPAPGRADDPVPIGEVIADPDAYHFRHIVMQGTVRRVSPLPPYTPRPDTTCYGAYTFVLEDGTGAIEVSVLGLCGTPVLRQPEVTDGETVVLVAQILSPHRLAPSSKEAAARLQAVASEIRHVARAEPPPSPSESVQAAESPKPGGDSRPTEDSGY